MIWRPITWSDDRDQIQARLCDMVGREMTREDWASLAGDLPYRAVCSS